MILSSETIPVKIMRMSEARCFKEASFMEFKSEKIINNNPNCKALLKSMGYTEEELGHQPRIGIANTWNDLVAGHHNLRQVAEHVKRGIYAAGGTACEFGTIAMCDGVTQSHIGMNYVLPSREIIANSVEAMVQGHQLDGLVALASCDKIIPGRQNGPAQRQGPLRHRHR